MICSLRRISTLVEQTFSELTFSETPRELYWENNHLHEDEEIWHKEVRSRVLVFIALHVSIERGRI
jgi:hypothetical protein